VIRIMLPIAAKADDVVMFHAKKDLKIERLANVELFNRCSPSELMHLATIADQIDLPAGYQLCREGRVAQECFVIIRGEAEVEINGEPVAIIGPGETVGEMGLLERKPRSATVTTVSPMSAYVIARSRFDDLLERYPTVARLILAELTGRLRRADERERQPVGAGAR
jgi:CRP/FNR family cyclic AMP-dependent transcriptional regulator